MDIMRKLKELECQGRLWMNKPLRNEKAEIDMGEIIMAIIAIVIGAILIGALLPTAVNSTNGGLNTSWSTSLQSTYNAIPILEVIAGLLVFVAIVIRLTRK